MDVNNGVGTDCGNKGQGMRRMTKEENWDNCNSTNNKKHFNFPNCFVVGGNIFNGTKQPQIL